MTLLHYSATGAPFGGEAAWLGFRADAAGECFLKSFFIFFFFYFSFFSTSELDIFSEGIPTKYP